MDHSKIIKKVKKLLALSKSDNEHEAAAAAAKAQALLAEHNLSMSDIPADDARCMRAAKAAAKTRIRLELWAHNLAHVTAGAFDCSYFHNTDGHTVFVGVGADQEVCAWTYAYLYKTLLRMGSSYLRQPQCRRLRTNKSRNAARASYLRGVVHTVGHRLEDQKKRTPVTETALVPVKQSLIEAAMPGNLRVRRVKIGRMRNNDLLNGMRDGKGVALSTPLNAAESCPLTGESTCD